MDLVRFACAFDDPQTCPILSSDSIAAMYTRPPGLAGHDEQGKPKDVYYSLGWLIRDLPNGQRNYWHTGSLSGTATLMVRRYDGRHFAVLFNTRSSPELAHLGRAIEERIHPLIRDTSNWPEGNQFGEFQ